MGLRAGSISRCKAALPGDIPRQPRTESARRAREVRLDLRDPAQDLAQGNWRVLIVGLPADASLSHGTRSLFNGSWWVVDADPILTTRGYGRKLGLFKQ